MANKHSVRWAFNIASWIPTESEILYASTYIQLEERDRIKRFVFEKDAKSSLIGRLMMRMYACLATGIPYKELRFGRDDYGKPVLVSNVNNAPDISFNVSHQGDYVVLAGESGTMKVGIDVMKNECTTNKNVPETFRLMRKQFSPLEWQVIYAKSSVKEQLASYYRFWSLKESYVKNVGVGISIDLSSISFAVGVDLLSPVPITTTQLYVNEHLQDNWLFEESLLDELHIVSVAVDFTLNKSHMPGFNPQQFKFLNYQDLIIETAEGNVTDIEFVQNFFSKEEKPF